MAANDAQKRAIAKYCEKYDDVKLRVPKGQREEWKRFAESKGKSLNQFIIDLMHAAMEADKANQE